MLMLVHWMMVLLTAGQSPQTHY
uniref:Uncharacterized protein n=1 Tax=Anguilla anguilla TaxID=7936 RepID=A0A0E9SUV5_ANGAN